MKSYLSIPFVRYSRYLNLFPSHLNWLRWNLDAFCICAFYSIFKFLHFILPRSPIFVTFENVFLLANHSHVLLYNGILSGREIYLILVKYKTGVISDPLGQTHSHASSCLLFCFYRFEKWGRTDGQYVRKQWLRVGQVDQYLRWKNCISKCCFINFSFGFICFFF